MKFGKHRRAGLLHSGFCFSFCDLLLAWEKFRDGWWVRGSSRETVLQNRSLKAMTYAVENIGRVTAAEKYKRISYRILPPACYHWLTQYVLYFQCPINKYLSYQITLIQYLYYRNAYKTYNYKALYMTWFIRVKCQKNNYRNIR